MAREWTMERIGEWNKDVFNRTGLFQCKGILHHIQREVGEMIQAHNELEIDPDDEYAKKALSMEVADMQILLEAYCYLVGINLDEAVDHKMFINENRKWKPQDEEGVAEHES